MSWKAIASTAAALALVAPSWAAGAERPDDRAGPLGVGAVQALTSTGTADGSTVQSASKRPSARSHPASAAAHPGPSLTTAHSRPIGVPASMATSWTVPRRRERGRSANTMVVVAVPMSSCQRRPAA